MAHLDGITVMLNRILCVLLEQTFAWALRLHASSLKGDAANPILELRCVGTGHELLDTLLVKTSALSTVLIL